MGRKLKQREYFFKEDIHMAKKKKTTHEKELKVTNY